MKRFCLFVVDKNFLCKEISALSSNHEESHTKLLLHAKHAAENGESTIIIKSQDKNVAILACHFNNQIPARLLIMRKVKTRVVYLDVSAISDAAGPQLCDALPGLHAFTGCDPVSSFSGNAKKASLKQCRTKTKQLVKPWQCWEIIQHRWCSLFSVWKVWLSHVWLLWSIYSQQLSLPNVC